MAGTQIAMPDNTPPPWVYATPADVVISQIAQMSGRADNALLLADSAISALGNLTIDGEGTAPPDLPFPDVSPTDIARPLPPSAIALGTVDPFNTPLFQEFSELYSQLDAVVANLPDPGDFEPSIGAIVIPAPPPPIQLGDKPIKPDLTDLVVPDAPNIVLPSMDAMLDLDIPDFVMPDFPVFTDIAINFEGETPNTVMNYTEQQYRPVVLDDVAREIKLALAGGTGMHPDVEEALFSRSRSKVYIASLGKTQEAFDTWAGRGFPMPPGMLVEQVNAAQQDAALAQSDIVNDILAKSAQWEIENLRNAIQQGIAMETVLINQFDNIAKRAFDMAKARVDADQALYSSQIALFNAQQAARSVLVEVFKAKIQAAMSLIDAYKAQIEAVSAKASVNESIVRAFAAKVDALKSVVAIYQAKIDAVKAQSDIQRNKVEMFKSETDAYSAGIDAQKTVFEAYEAQVRGEAAKGSIIESEARAFAATVEATSANGNVKIAAIRGKIDAIGAAVGKFTALIGGERDRVGAQATAIQAKAQAFSADASRYTAELGANTEEVRLDITQTESRLRNNLAYYETRVREYDQAMTRLQERSRIIVAALSASGNMAAQLASGAMSAMHVQASLSGSGSASTSWSSGYSYSENHSFEDESTSHE